jgi:hypothetical protein
MPHDLRPDHLSDGKRADLHAMMSSWYHASPSSKVPDSTAELGASTTLSSAQRRSIDPQTELSPQPKQFSRFLDLPAEIRNQIYDLVIPNSHVAVKSTHPQRERNALRKHCLFSEDTLSRNRLFGRILSIDDEETDPLHIMRVCRQAYQEVTLIFYSKTTLCFDTMQSIRKFLNRASKAGIGSVRALDIKINSYGEPQLTKDCAWKSKWDGQWDDLCARLAREMISLRRVYLDLTLATWPTQLSPHADWCRPLLRLKGQGLHLVTLKLRHYRFDENRLAFAARKMEDRMMTPRGREERALWLAVEAAREMDRRAAAIAYEEGKNKPKPFKILVIKAPKTDDTQVSDKRGTPVAQGSQQGPVQSVYRTKGLAGYHRIDLSMVGVACCP